MGHSQFFKGAAALVLTILLVAVSRAEPLSPAAQRGLVFVRANCAKCPAVEHVGNSPLRIAPPFRTLHERYPVETLLELLSSGMTFDEILADYEDLERDDLRAVLAFAARLSQTKRLPSVGP